MQISTKWNECTVSPSPECSNLPPGLNYTKVASIPRYVVGRGLTDGGSGLKFCKIIFFNTQPRLYSCGPAC